MWTQKNLIIIANCVFAAIFNCLVQCCGAASVIMRIRIQDPIQKMSIWIRILGGTVKTKEEKNYTKIFLTKSFKMTLKNH